MDRPSRKTKVVNYCEAKDFDDDEDFAVVKAPPSKKPREEKNKQELKKSSSKPSSQESSSQSKGSQKSRVPLDERLRERDLEAAIVLSLLNSENGMNDQSFQGVAKAHIVVDENTDPASLHWSNCSVDSTKLGLDEISSEKDAHGKAATKASEDSRKTLADNDDDYEPKLTPDSESDDDFSELSESEDEEFKVKKASKTKKGKVTNNVKTKQPPASKKEKPAPKPSKSKSQATASTPVRSPPTPKLAPAASTPVRSPPTPKLAPKRPPLSTVVSTSRPASSLSPAAGRIPKWTPPGQIGRSPTSSTGSAVKSPGQGLRLGLSRLVRVKPLHPSVASH